MTENKTIPEYYHEMIEKILQEEELIKIYNEIKSKSISEIIENWQDIYEGSQ